MSITKTIPNIWFYTLVGSIAFLTLIVIVLLLRKPELPIDVQRYKLEHAIDSLNVVIDNDANMRTKLNLQIDSLNNSIARIETSVIKKQKEIQQLRKEYEETINHVNSFSNDDINSYFAKRYSE
jgi:septal ring factor EnvC (AmiA/AmiB activator)